MLMPKRQQLHVDEFFHEVAIASSHFKYVQVVITSMFCSTISNSIRGCKCWWHFKNIRKKDLMSYSWTIETLYSWPIYNETNLRFLNLGSNIRNNMLCVFFCISLPPHKRTTQIPFFIFEANKVNSLTIPKSSSIILLKLGGCCQVAKYAQQNKTILF